MVTYLICPRCGVSHLENEDCVPILKAKIRKLEEDLNRANRQTQDQTKDLLQRQIHVMVTPKK